MRALCLRYAGMVAATCRRLGAHDPDEATQAVFIVLARRAGSVDARKLMGWLAATARRVVADQRRAVASRRRHEQEAAMEHARQRAGIPGETAWEEARAHLDGALASLSSARREALMRFYLEGKSQTEVAAELGCSVDAVKTRIHDGMERLRSYFARRGAILGVAALASGLASEAAAHEPALAASCAAAVHAPTQGVAALAAGTGASAVATTVLASVALVVVGLGGIAVWPRERVASMAEASPPMAEPRPPIAVTSPPIAVTPATTAPRVLAAEAFDDDGSRARGWYDNPRFTTIFTDPSPGGGGTAEFRFPVGGKTPLSGGPGRRAFTPMDAIRISFWMKHGADWTDTWAAVQLLILTTADGRWVDPSSSHLTCAIGVNRGTPFISLQDALNIDAGRMGIDLVRLTERRSVAGGNGDGDGHGPGETFLKPDGRQGNRKRYHVPEAAFSHPSARNAIGRWHRIEVRLRLNRVVDGKGIPDGRLAYLVDGWMALERRDVLFRTGRHPDMRFNQLVIGPWTDGAPREQVFWIDDLTVSAEPESASHQADPAP